MGSRRALCLGFTTGESCAAEVPAWHTRPSHGPRGGAASPGGVLARASPSAGVVCSQPHCLFHSRHRKTRRRSVLLRVASPSCLRTPTPRKPWKLTAEPTSWSPRTGASSLAPRHGRPAAASPEPVEDNSLLCAIPISYTQTPRFLRPSP